MSAYLDGMKMYCRVCLAERPTGWKLDPDVYGGKLE